MRNVQFEWQLSATIIHHALVGNKISSKWEISKLVIGNVHLGM